MRYEAAISTNAVANAPMDVRAAFLRKVYHPFFLSLILTVGVAWVAVQPPLREPMTGLVPLFLIAGLVCIVALSFARRVPVLNVTLFYLYAALQGAVVGPILLQVERTAPGVPAQAALLTVATFGALSLYVLQTGKDFSYLGGMLLVGLIALLVSGIAMFFVHSSLVNTLYSLAGILIFCGYVLYDTSVIMNRLGPDDAVTGAISIYLDFINLFWFILRLLMQLSRRN